MEPEQKANTITITRLGRILSHTSNYDLCYSNRATPENKDIISCNSIGCFGIYIEGNIGTDLHPTVVRDIWYKKEDVYCLGSYEYSCCKSLSFMRNVITKTDTELSILLTKTTELNQISQIIKFVTPYQNPADESESDSDTSDISDISDDIAHPPQAKKEHKDIIKMDFHLIFDRTLYKIDASYVLEHLAHSNAAHLFRIRLQAFLAQLPPASIIPPVNYIENIIINPTISFPATGQWLDNYKCGASKITVGKYNMIERKRTPTSHPAKNNGSRRLDKQIEYLYKIDGAMRAFIIQFSTSTSDNHSTIWQSLKKNTLFEKYLLFEIMGYLKISPHVEEKNLEHKVLERIRELRKSKSESENASPSRKSYSNLEKTFGGEKFITYEEYQYLYRKVEIELGREVRKLITPY
jgi:hypothetical protein